MNFLNFLEWFTADRQHDERGVMLMLDVEDRHADNETPSSASTVAPRALQTSCSVLATWCSISVHSSSLK